MQKRVQIIVDCACLTCDKVRKDNCDISDEDTLELPSNLFLNTNSTNKTQPQKVPELLKMQSHVYDGNKPHHPNKKKLLELLVGRNDSSDESDNDIFEDILKMHDDDEDVIRLPDDSLKRNHYNVGKAWRHCTGGTAINLLSSSRARNDPDTHRVDLTTTTPPPPPPPSPPPRWRAAGGRNRRAPCEGTARKHDSGTRWEAAHRLGRPEGQRRGSGHLVREPRHEKN